MHNNIKQQKKNKKRNKQKLRHKRKTKKLNKQTIIANTQQTQTKQQNTN